MAKFLLSSTAVDFVTFNEYSGDNVPLIDPNDPDDVELLTQPARGFVVKRADQKGFDYFNHENIETDSVSFTYNRITGAETLVVTATVNLTRPEAHGGWSRSGFNLPPVDPATNKAVFWPGKTTRIVKVAADGLLFNEIAEAEAALSDTASIGAVANWIIANPCTVAPNAGVYYGASDALAISSPLAELVFDALLTSFQSPWLLSKGGDTFTTTKRYAGEMGESKVHPILIGAYGTGRPYFASNAPWIKGTCYVAVQDIAYGDKLELRDISHLCVDGIYGDGQYKSNVGTGLEFGGATGSSGRHTSDSITIRRSRIYDASTKIPGGGDTYWSAGERDRGSAMYATNMSGVLVEEFHSDLSGWNIGYRGDWLYTDGISFWPRGPDEYSHGFYFQNNTNDIFFRNSIITRPSGSDFQLRGGGMVQNVNTSYANSGNVHELGWHEEGGAQQGINGRIGYWGYSDRYVKHTAGLKNYYVNQTNSDARGINLPPEGVVPFRTAVLNMGTALGTFTSGDQIGPLGGPLTPRNNKAFEQQSIYRALSAPANTPVYVRDHSGMIIGNWNPGSYPNQNVNGLDATQIAGLDISEYAKILLDNPAATYHDFCDHLRTLENPIASELENMQRFQLSPLGVISSTVRTTPQTCVFQQYAVGSPGYRMDIELDWMQGDLPGTVAGDSIDMAGHHGQGSFNPKNQITDFTVGPSLLWNGGCMDLLGDFIVPASGSSLTVRDNGHFYINDKTGGDLTLEVVEGVFMNRGALTGVDATFRYGSIGILAYEGGSYTVGSGDTLTVYGYADVGFEGDSGGTATLNLNAGGTLKFKPSLRFSLLTSSLTGEIVNVSYDSSGSFHTPTPGSTFLGENANQARCVGQVVGAFANGNDRVWVYADDLIGPAFVDTETITGPTTACLYYDRGTKAIGDIEGTHQPVMGAITNVQSGMHGFDANGDVIAENVASVANLNGINLEIDLWMMGNVTDFPLIDIGSVVHNANFGAVTINGGDEKDVTIDVTPTQVLLTIADGTGGVTVNYPA